MQLVIRKRNLHAFFRVPDNRCLVRRKRWTLMNSPLVLWRETMRETRFEEHTEFGIGGAYL
jgi:hypothetical protein